MPTPRSRSPTDSPGGTSRRSPQQHLQPGPALRRSAHLALVTGHEQCAIEWRIELYRRRPPCQPRTRSARCSPNSGATPTDESKVSHPQDEPDQGERFFLSAGQGGAVGGQIRARRDIDLVAPLGFRGQSNVVVYNHHEEQQERQSSSAHHCESQRALGLL